MTVDSGWRALCRYRSEWLRADLLAGVGVAVLAIPVIAYAELAGLPPQTGLVTVCLGCWFMRCWVLRARLLSVRMPRLRC